jgi:hypothetical protein
MRMQVNASPPPTPLALDYCARKLMAFLESGHKDRDAETLARRMTPTTAALLRWWFSGERCRARIDNFNAGQRQAILHTVIAHEILRSDDPQLLYRLACDPGLAAAQEPHHSPHSAAYATYALRLAPGSGLRWVAQALLLWQWASHEEASARAVEDPRFSDRLALLGADARLEARLRDGLFGPVDGRGHRDTFNASPIRHAHLFLPPAVRDRAHDWLAGQARGGGDAILRIGMIASGRSAPLAPTSAIVLAAGIGSGLLAASDKSCKTALPPDAPDLRHAAFLWVDLALDDATAVAPAPAIAEFSLQRAIARDAVKLPMLEPTQHLRLAPLRATRSRGNGLRPVLSPAHRRLLAMGLRALTRREPGFASLDPARRPQLLVLCDASRLLRGVRRALIESGVASVEIAMPEDRRAGDCRILIEALQTRPTFVDPKICVVVVLRTHAADESEISALGAGLGLLWPEPDFAGVRNENRARAALGHAPDTLIDVLSIVEHPQCHERYADLLRAGLTARGEIDRRDCDDAMRAIGDLIVSPLRENAVEFDIRLPIMRSFGSDTGDGTLLDQPSRILLTRRAVPVRKSPYRHEAWSEHDSGLRRAFLECAESDPAIESHCLPDPRRHGIGIREALSVQGFAPQGWPDALVRTADTVYLVMLSPSCPVQSPGPGERALSLWCSRANALPGAEHRRRWRSVALQAPLFWSWKRNESPLSSLLAALAETAPFMRRASPSLID